MKSGRSRAGQKAAGSHTAALAGSDTAVDAVFRQAGVIRADTLGGLLDVAALLSCQPVPRGRRVAVLTNAGGLGILCADACEVAGLELPQLGEETRAALAAALPCRGVRREPRRHARLGHRRQLPRCAADGARRSRHRRRDRAVRATRRRRCRRRRGCDQPGDGRGESTRQAGAGSHPRRERRSGDAALGRPDPVVRLPGGGSVRTRTRGRLRQLAAPLGRHGASARGRRHRSGSRGRHDRTRRRRQTRGSIQPRPAGSCSHTASRSSTSASRPRRTRRRSPRTSSATPSSSRRPRRERTRPRSGGVALDLDDAAAVHAAAARIGGAVIVQPHDHGRSRAAGGRRAGPGVRPARRLRPGRRDRRADRRRPLPARRR